MTTADPTWQHPLRKIGVLSGSLSVETVPFVFQGRLYRLENVPKAKEFPHEIPQYRFHEDEIRVRDVAENRVVSVVLHNHYFGSVFVWQERVYVFAGDYGTDQPWWHIRRIVMTSSDDLLHWTEPVTVIESERGEHLFNTAVCRGADGFVMLYETDDDRWPKFTFKYCTSPDLVHWTRVPEGIYGRDKYVGGPALYSANGWYYTLYLHALDGIYETRVTRSRDLVAWEDAPEDRPFLPVEPGFVPQSDLFPDVRELSASDAKLCEWQGRTLVYYFSGNQQGQGAVRLAEFDGGIGELLEGFYQS